MKWVFLFVFCVLACASPAWAISFGSDGTATLTPAEYQNFLLEFNALKSDLGNSKKETVAARGNMEAAIVSDIKNSEAYKKILQLKDKRIAKEVKKNDKLENSWGHKLEVLVHWAFWGIVATYVIAFLGGFVNPLGKFSWLFRLSSELVKVLPLANPLRWFNPKLITVRAATVPVIPVNIPVQVADSTLPMGDGNG